MIISGEKTNKDKESHCLILWECVKCCYKEQWLGFTWGMKLNTCRCTYFHVYPRGLTSFVLSSGRAFGNTSFLWDCLWGQMLNYMRWSLFPHDKKHCAIFNINIIILTLSPPQNLVNDHRHSVASPLWAGTILWRFTTLPHSCTSQCVSSHSTSDY